MQRKPPLLMSLMVVIALILPSYAASSIHGSTSQNPTQQNAVNQQVFLPLVKNDVPPVVPATTEVIGAATLQDLVSVSPDNTTFTFSEDSPKLDALNPGDVMVGGVSAAAPYGFLRKVQSVTEQNGDVIVQTANATLEDAITDGSISVSQSLSPADVRQTHLAKGVGITSQAMASTAFEYRLDKVVLYDDDGNLATTNDQIVANGSIELRQAFDFNLSIKGWKVKDVTFKSTSSETAELNISSQIVKSSVSKTKEIARQYLGPITFMIGPVPVVLTPVLSVNVGIDGSVQVSMQAGLTQELSAVAGMRYANGTWQPIHDFSNTFTPQPLTVSASLTVKGYTGANLDLLLYGVIGSKVAAQPYLELDADTTATPWWQLYGGFKVSGSVEILVLSRVIPRYDATLIDYRHVFAKASTPAPSPTPTATIGPSPTATPPTGPSPTPTATFGPTATPTTGRTTRVAAGEEPSISADGRYVAFVSYASTLVPGDTNGYPDVFVHDRQSGQTTRVSVASNGSQANGYSRAPSISADGRFVAFESNASTLVSGDTNVVDDVFVHDRQSGQTTRVSVASNGSQANGYSHAPSISADGRYVAFGSGASTLVSGDTNGYADVFVHDRQSGQTTRVSVASNGTQANDGSDVPSISADGRFVAFGSGASTLVSGDTNGYADVFVHDRQSGQTTRVSVASNGTQANGDSNVPSISADGRYVAFQSGASTLVPGDTNEYWDVFVHDRQTGQTTRVSVASDGSEHFGLSLAPSISADGRYVAFQSGARRLVSGDTNVVDDVFVHDRQTSQTTRVSVASDGSQAYVDSLAPSISADGRYVAFHSYDSTLVPGDTNGDADVFVHDRGTP